MVKLDKFRNLGQDGGSLLLLKYEKGERKAVDLNHPKTGPGSSCNMQYVQERRPRGICPAIPPEHSLPHSLAWLLWFITAQSLLIQTRRAEHDVNWPNPSYQAHKTERIKLPGLGYT